jgi:hypothetical protein
MSQIRLNVPLFYLSQDHIAIEELLAIGTGLDNKNHSGSSTRFKEIHDPRIRQ